LTVMGVRYALLLSSIAFSCKVCGVCYNRLAHMSLGPGVPKSRRTLPFPNDRRHVLPDGHRVTSTPVLGGLHHEYFLESVAA